MSTRRSLGHGIPWESSQLYWISPHSYDRQAMMPIWHDARVSHGQRQPEEESTFVSTQAPAVLARLLPDATTVHREACSVDDVTAQITLLVTSTPSVAPCPLCNTLTLRAHSWYERTLADLPWGAYHSAAMRRGWRPRDLDGGGDCRRHAPAAACPVSGIGRKGDSPKARQTQDGLTLLVNSKTCGDAGLQTTFKRQRD
jgi:hypothetical protein